MRSPQYARSNLNFPFLFALTQATFIMAAIIMLEKFLREIFIGQRFAADETLARNMRPLPTELFKINDIGIVSAKNPTCSNEIKSISEICYLFSMTKGTEKDIHKKRLPHSFVACVNPCEQDVAIKVLQSQFTQELVKTYKLPKDMQVEFENHGALSMLARCSYNN